MSAIATLALTRILAEPAIFLPLDVTTSGNSFPLLSRRKRTEEKSA